MAARLEYLLPSARSARDSCAAEDPAAAVLASAGSLDVLLAREPADVDRAFRQRYRVFAEELGAARRASITTSTIRTAST